MKINTLVTSVLMATTLLAAGACSAVNAQSGDNAGQPSKEITITDSDEFIQNAHIQKQIEISNGESLVVTLFSNGTTGFSWNEQAQIDNAEILQQVNHQVNAPTSDAMGAPGTEQWNFNSLKSGTTNVHFEYGRPWEGGEKGIWTVDIAVTVK